MSNVPNGLRSHRRPQAQLSTLQAGRAVAALMVVLFHVQIFILPQRLYAGEGAFDPLRIGYSGVEFFFALSGFLMAHVHRHDIGRPERAPNYLMKRVTRIYPLYWVVVAALLLAYAIVPGTGPGAYPGSGEIAANLALLPLPDNAIIQVAWTLQFEMMFYLLFALALLSRRFGLLALGAWFVLCALNLVFWEPIFPLSFLLSPYNLIFFGGIVAARSFQKLRGGQAIAVLVAGLLVFFGTSLADLYAVWPGDFAWRTVSIGFGASLIVCGLAACERLGLFSAPAFIRELGDSSYALYIVHMPVLIAAVPLIKALGLNTAILPLGMAVLLSAGCLLAGVLAHRHVEKPLQVFCARVVAAIQRHPAAAT